VSTGFATSKVFSDTTELNGRNKSLVGLAHSSVALEIIHDHIDVEIEVGGAWSLSHREKFVELIGVKAPSSQVGGRVHGSGELSGEPGIVGCGSVGSVEKVFNGDGWRELLTWSTPVLGLLESVRDQESLASWLISHGFIGGNGHANFDTKASSLSGVGDIDWELHVETGIRGASVRGDSVGSEENAITPFFCFGALDEIEGSKRSSVEHHRFVGGSEGS